MLTFISPAKINLFLKVLGRRLDGYHDLASLFQAISLHDTLHFELAECNTLICSDPSIPTDSSNLIFKAASLFRSKTGLKFGLKCILEKHIPHEAGLGGGSSNAATTLWALNQLHGMTVPLEQLIDWSSEIGSDITFFLSQGTAYCTGRGEILRPLEALPYQTLWIVKPPQGLSTPKVFKHLNLDQLSKYDPENSLENFYLNQPCYYNDLEEAAFILQPSLQSLKHQLLESGFQTVLMTGSGTAFFCLGNGIIPEIAGVRAFRVHFMRRTVSDWY